MPYCVNEIDTPEVWSEMQKWIAENNIQVSERPGETADQIKSDSIASITNQLASLDKKCSREAEDAKIPEVMNAIVDPSTNPPTTRAMIINQKNILRTQLAELNT
jgi:hypothetical protein